MGWFKRLFKKKNNSPYCPHCNSCGETGCCSPTICTNHPDGYYCETNRRELRISYYTLNEFWSSVVDKDIEKKLSEIYDKYEDEEQFKINN